MNVVSLCSGVGLIDLGLEWAGMRTVQLCEVDSFCQRVLARRFPGVPVHPDAWTIEPKECDVIAAGFPCQPFSLAGQRLGADDPRHLWPAIIRSIRLARPRYVILENVPGLITLGLGDVLGDLAEAGYDAEWTVFGAADVGAPHRRDRIWIVGELADADGASADRVEPGGDGRGGWRAGAGGAAGVRPGDRGSSDVGSRSGGRGARVGSGWFFADGWGTDALAAARKRRVGAVPDADQERRGEGVLVAAGCGEPARSGDVERSGSIENVADAVCGGREPGAGFRASGSGGLGGRRPGDGGRAGGWWAAEPGVRGMADGSSDGMDGGGVDASERMGAEGDAAQRIEGLLRELWGGVASRAAPQGRRSDEQLARELGDALRVMPHVGALAHRETAMATASEFLRGVRKAAYALGSMRDASDTLAEIWVALSEERKKWCWLAACVGSVWAAEWPNTSRVADGVPARMDRLRALGNGVVPQCAELVGLRVIQAVEASA